MVNKYGIRYFKASLRAYNSLHDLPFVGNEQYWASRIFCYDMMQKLHLLEREFEELKAHTELPIDVYMDIKTRIDFNKSRLKRWLISIPIIENRTPIEETRNQIFKKIEKIGL